MRRDWQAAANEDLFGIKTMENESKGSVSARSHLDDDSKSVISAKMAAPLASSATAENALLSAKPKLSLGKAGMGSTAATALKNKSAKTNSQLTDIAEGKAENTSAAQQAVQPNTDKRRVFGSQCRFPK